MYDLQGLYWDSMSLVKAFTYSEIDIDMFKGL